MFKIYISLSNLFPIFLGVLLCVCPSAYLTGKDTSKWPSLDTLRRNHIEYGKDFNVQLNSFFVSGTIENYEGGVESVRSKIKVFKKRPHKLRSIYEQALEEVSLKIEFIYDGKRGVRKEFIDDRQNAELELSGDALRAIQTEAFVDSLFLRASEKMGVLKVEGIEMINGVECVRLSVNGFEYGPIQTIWLRLDNYQEAKHSLLKTSSDGKPILEEIYFSHYLKSEGGILYPSASERYINGVIAYRFKVDQFKPNLGLFNSFFKIE